MEKSGNSRIANGRRKQLLATVSAIALIASAYVAERANAADKDRPVLWVEGGWHFEKLNSLGDPFLPSFAALMAQGGFTPLSVPQKALDQGYGAEGKISFQPEDSNWIFLASVRYGRSHGRRRVHQEIAVPEYQHVTPTFGGGTSLSTRTMDNNYNETAAGNRETHVIADFQAGKDVGLGLFGKQGSSIASLGVRFAQFGTTSDMHVYARPDGHFELEPAKITVLKYIPFPFFHNYKSFLHRESDFRGIGPSISWMNSTPLFGDNEDGEIALDWGANASLLFGRQETKVHHDTLAGDHYAVKTYPFPGNTAKYAPHTASAYSHNVADHVRRRSVLVPNIGGFAGISYQFVDAKLSIGYRADFFFGAIDGGIDSRHSTTRGFHGPFASVSIGIGD